MCEARANNSPVYIYELYRLLMAANLCSRNLWLPSQSQQKKLCIEVLCLFHYGSIRGEEFFTYGSNNKLLKKDSVPKSCLLCVSQCFVIRPHDLCRVTGLSQNRSQ